MSSPTIGVQSIRRAFAVLGVLADGPLGVTGVAARSHIPKSTAARLLAALAAEGAVEQIPGESRYRLGPHLTALASGLGDARGLVATARPTLVDLAGELGEAAGLSVRDGWTVHYVDQVESPNPVQVRDWTGTRIPLHAVSSGQVFLAQLPAPTLSRYLAESLEQFTPRTLTAAPALLERLREVRREGLAWVREEYAVGHQLRRGTDRGRAGRGRCRGPCPRSVVPVPGRGLGGRHRARGARRGGENRLAPPSGRVSATQRRSGLAESRGTTDSRWIAVVAALILVGTALRPQALIIGPLVGLVQADLGMSHGVAGLLSTIPVLCMGFLAPLGPVLAGSDRAAAGRGAVRRAGWRSSASSAGCCPTRSSCSRRRWASAWGWRSSVRSCR